jgi:hypothetical protein
VCQANGYRKARVVRTEENGDGADKEQAGATIDERGGGEVDHLAHAGNERLKARKTDIEIDAPS